MPVVGMLRRQVAAGLSLLAVTTLLSTALLADDLTTVSDPESLGFSAARLARIGDVFRSRVAQAQASKTFGEGAGEPSGAVIAIARNGKLAHLEAIGFQDRARTIPMKTDSIFWIDSMTMPITSVAAMILVDDGKLQLDAPVSRYLPQLAGMQVGVVDKDASGATAIKRQPAKRAMTVRDLLRHTSGLVRWREPGHSDPIYALYAKAAFMPDKTLAEFVASLSDLPLAHQPAEVFEYGWSTDVLARVVEVASGRPFDEFLQSKIFRPLRMADTGFYVPMEKLDRLVEAPEPRWPYYDVTRPRKLLSGGAGLASTATDYLRFCQMLLNGGELDGTRLLKAGTVQLMTRNALSPDMRAIGYPFDPTSGSGFGLGVAIRTNPEFSTMPGAVGSYGWHGTWGTRFWVDPAEKLIAIQMLHVKADKAAPYLTTLRIPTYGALQVPQSERVAEPMVPITPSDDTLNSFAGKYDFGFSPSSHDVINSSNRFARIGLNSLPEPAGFRITRVFDNLPAAAAGLQVGDLIIAVNDAAVQNISSPSRMIEILSGAVGSQVKLHVMRGGQGAAPLLVTLTRAPIYIPGVELEVRADSGKLTIEATGPVPVLDFEKGKAVAMKPKSDSEFEVDGGDRTRIAFVKDDLGKIVGAVLNPGPWQQKGVRLPEGTSLMPN